jgi:integrase/recombinase XerD
LSEEDWDKSQSLKARGEYKEYQTYFNKIEQKAIEIIKGLDSFSFQAFDKAFNQKTDRSKDVFYYMENYMDQLKKESRSGTENSYKCAYNSFKSYLKTKGRKNFNFSDLTPEWLQNYENWMVGNGKSLTSTGIYLRSLRTIVNIAVEEGVMSREFYPFGKRKYSIPAGRNVKKALTIQEIKSIVSFQTKTDAEQKAKDIWMLSYLCNGANMKDIALLRWKDLDSKRLVFVRAKTARTSKQDSKPVVVMLLPEIKEIILKWGQNSQKPDDYIFGIISQNDNSEDILKKVRQFIKTTNKYMKRIGNALELDLTLTSYSARHSFATVLKRSGAPIEFISESLGHKDLRTTENYLGSFEDDIKESYQKQLLNFD